MIKYHPLNGLASGSVQNTYSLQQLERTLQVVQIAQVDVGNSDFAERLDRGVRLNVLTSQRILVGLAGEVLLGLGT